VGQLRELEKVMDFALSEYGAVDIWVNNAGVSPAYGPTMDINHLEVEDVIQTNILGAYYGSMLAVRHFVDRGNGKLINILGRGYRKPIPYQNAYASSKSWLYNFTLALAHEYKESGIGIYAFSPGIVDTDMLRKVRVVDGYESSVDRLETVMRMWGNPARVPSDQAVWIASSETDGRTGLVIKTFTKRLILKGLIGEVWRKMRRQTPEPIEISITRILPAARTEIDNE
jgi:NAD(P)-dependent dehydrogenase (short-subunit alcohol dehydrogenase family)